MRRRISGRPYRELRAARHLHHCGVVDAHPVGLLLIYSAQKQGIALVHVSA